MMARKRKRKCKENKKICIEHKTMVNKQIIHWTNMIKITEEREWNSFCGYKSNYIENIEAYTWYRFFQLIPPSQGEKSFYVVIFVVWRSKSTITTILKHKTYRHYLNNCSIGTKKEKKNINNLQHIPGLNLSSGGKMNWTTKRTMEFFHQSLGRGRGYTRVTRFCFVDY